MSAVKILVNSGMKKTGQGQLLSYRCKLNFDITRHWMADIWNYSTPTNAQVLLAQEDVMVYLL